MTDSELNNIRALLAAATAGPWFARQNDLIGGWCVCTTDAQPSQGAGEVADFVREEDARFIAACSPTVIAALLAEVDRLRAELAEAEATLANARGEGEPPEEGWHAIGRTWWLGREHVAGSVKVYHTGRRWEWWVKGTSVCGEAPTARAAMRAELAAAKGGDGG